jgi:hypothetical protein
MCSVQRISPPSLPQGEMNTTRQRACQSKREWLRTSQLELRIFESQPIREQGLRESANQRDGVARVSQSESRGIYTSNQSDPVEISLKLSPTLPGEPLSGM